MAASGGLATGRDEYLMPRIETQSGEKSRLAEQREAAIGPNTGLRYSPGMRIIALATLKAFVDARSAHANAREPVMAWYRQVKAADWAGPADVKRDVRSASILRGRQGGVQHRREQVPHRGVDQLSLPGRLHPFHR